MNLFNFLKDRIQVVDVIKEYVSLKKAGTYYKGRCPFHHEKDASFTVSPHKQIFYCFGCQATGDVIAFIAQIEGCSQFEAAKFIIDKYNIEVPPQLLNEKQESSGTISQKNHYYQLCEAIATWCAQQLQSNQDAKTYLNERKLTQNIIEQFDIGYFPPGQSNLKKLQQHLLHQGFLIKDLFDQHILIESQKGLYSPFEDRIIFPISDHIGRYCGFGGRVFKPHDERAKYYNSRENTFFAKGSLLFGLQHAKKAIQKTTTAFLVEGYFDCIMMVQHGYPNTIATLGTTCSIEHLKLLAQHTDTLFVIFDGDAAGLRAMLRLTQLCWHANINIRIICLPKNEDPASFLGEGHKLEPYVERAQDIFTFFIDNASTQFKQQSLRGKLAIVHELIEIIMTIDDNLKQVILLQDAAESLHIPYAILQRECDKQQTYHNAEPDVQKPESDDTSATERKLFALIINNPKLLEREEVILLLDLFPESICRILNQFNGLSTKTLDELVPLLSEQDKQLTYTLIMTHDETEANDPEAVIASAIRHSWKVLAQKIKERVAQAHQCNDHQQVTRLLEHLQELKKKMLTRSLP